MERMAFAFPYNGREVHSPDLDSNPEWDQVPFTRLVKLQGPKFGILKLTSLPVCSFSGPSGVGRAYSEPKLY